MSVFFQEKNLAQTVGVTTLPALFYQKPSGKTAIIKHINVCNVNTVSTTFAIYHNPGGTSFGITTTIQPPLLLNPNDRYTFTEYMALGASLASIGIASGTTGVCFSMFGAEITE